MKDNVLTITNGNLTTIHPSNLPQRKWEDGQQQKIVRFFDTHGHARNPLGAPDNQWQQGQPPRMLTAVRATAPYCQVQYWMPNTTPKPITGVADVKAYHESLGKCTPPEFKNGVHPFTHRVIAQLMPGTQISELRKLRHVGINKVKIYPQGVTTNSQSGWSDLDAMHYAIENAVKEGMLVCVHGESPGSMTDTYEREKIFCKAFKTIVCKFPHGRFRLEHISTKEGVDTVRELRRHGYSVFGGITAHHLVMNRNDVLEWQGSAGHSGINAHHHCRPPANTMEDMWALQEAALNAHNESFFMLGSDSAPHFAGAKLCACGCAGLFTAPILAPLLVQFFDEHGAFLNGDTQSGSAFQAFTFRNALHCHQSDEGRFSTDNTFTLVRKPWTIPASYGGIIPPFAGCKLAWTPTDSYILDPNATRRPEEAWLPQVGGQDPEDKLP